jgi:hypothetical protein
MAERAEIPARPGVRLKLLPLKLQVKRLGGMATCTAIGLTLRFLLKLEGPQCCLSHRQGAPGTGLDQQQFFLYANVANRH